ncbi:MAG: glycoside-pentoside-hexuronide (GPH):cation symporter [Reichenbachiella sp.]
MKKQGQNGMEDQSILPRFTKFNYAVGDFANNIVWNAMSIYLAYFYTDVFGLDPAHMGYMFLAVRLFDAVTDPLVGMWADRTRNKYGQCRSFLLYGSIPLGISFIMLFYTPDVTDGLKLVYAYGSYALLTLAYTIVNVPYSTMAGNLSNSSSERTSLQSYRFGVGLLASVLVAAIVLPLVDFFGEGDEKTGFFLTAGVLSVLIVIGLLYCFRMVKERYLPEVGTQQSLGNDMAVNLKSVLSNSQLVIILVINSLFTIAFVLRASAQIYYTKEVMVEAKDMMSIFLTLGTVAMALGAALSSFIWGRFDKSVVFRRLMYAITLVLGLLYIVPGTELYLIIFIWLVGSFLMMSSVPLCWSMVSDIVDFQRFKSGKLLGGLIFALFLFTIKFGVGVGGALIGWVLSTTGYKAGMDQSLSTIEAINASATILPAVLILISAFIMHRYKLDRNKIQEIHDGLYGTK